MPRSSWIVAIVRSNTGWRTRLRLRRSTLAAALAACALALLPGTSVAAICTDTWTGPAEGDWETAADWSLGAVPTSSDVACIGPKTTVNVPNFANVVGVLNVEGTLLINGGSLEVTNALETSTVAALSMTGGTLKGAGSVDISESLFVKSGTMRGAGVTTLEPGASADIAEKEGALGLEGHTFVNEGKAALEGGRVDFTSNSKFVNTGTFVVNSGLLPGGSLSGGSSTSGVFVNDGTLEKPSTELTEISVELENNGTVRAVEGGGFKLKYKGVWGNGSVLEGLVELQGVTSNLIFHNVQGEHGKFKLAESLLEVATGSTAKIGVMETEGGIIAGAGTLEITKAIGLYANTMQDSGATVIAHGATASTEGDGFEIEKERQFINHGVVTIDVGSMSLSDNARLVNYNTFEVNAEHTNYTTIQRTRGTPTIQNYGLIKKTSGTGTTVVEPPIESLGAIVTYTGHLSFSNPVTMLTPTQFAERSPSARHLTHSACGDPVNCATGNLYETQTDFVIGGRGVGLDLMRTYNSQAASEGASGAFGHGWSNTFSDHLVAEKEAATVYQGNGSTVSFAESAGEFTAPVWSQDKLTGNATSGYTLTLETQVQYKFEGSTGRLESVTDRNGNTTTLAYDKAGQLETITDPSGRTVTLAYNGEGFVESAKDPMGHTVKYTYEAGNLATVTEPGEASPRWKFHYDGSHQMTSMVDGRGGTTANEYNGSHQLISQTDPAEHKLKFEYEPFFTKITNNTTESVTDEWFNSYDEPVMITRGAGTASAVTETFTYNSAGDQLSKTDGNGHTTEYAYDAASDRTEMIDPDGDKTKWGYDSTHDVTSITTPGGETTKIARNANGDAESVSRPAPGETTQTTKYGYGAHDEVTSMVDPLGHTWQYEYDKYGDRSAETDPLGDKRTFEYDEDSREKAMVNPNGNAKGGEPAQYETKIERDAQGRPTTLTDPLGHTTKYAYNADGYLEAITDGNGHTTEYTYNGDNQPTLVKLPNSTTAETAYDGAGRMISQTDGDKHTSKYVRNVLGEVTEVVDPLGRKTTEEYDAAGNMTHITDPLKRTTTYAYDPANRLVEITYSDGKTPTVKYEYDADGNRVKMVDGTGTSTYTYDQLDRMTQSVDGNGDKAGFGYDLANQQVKLTYPNGDTVEREYDTAGRLKTVRDWTGHFVEFHYDADSNIVRELFHKESIAEAKLEYDHADHELKTTLQKEGATFASLTYARDSDAQIKLTTSTGLPGAESIGSGYDEDNHLTKYGGTSYEYDHAGNRTVVSEGTKTLTTIYNEEGEPKVVEKAGPSYSYDLVGERINTGVLAPITTYGYDQAGNLISVTRPAEAKYPEDPAIKDTYAYDGNGLRVAQTIGEATSHLTWNLTGPTPTILSDGQNSYIYGPNGIPVEQIPAKGSQLFMLHDQQGSIRALVPLSGPVEATMTYDAYGDETGKTGSASTPFGYDGQYTNADTGLIYMRAREYDPATAQFLTVDPLLALSRVRYVYAYDNPLAFSDPSGRLSFEEVVEGATSAAESTADYVIHNPVIVSAAGCTAGVIAGPEVCAGAIAVSYSDSTAQNIAKYASGEYSYEQLVARQLFLGAASVAGTIPSLSLLEDEAAAGDAGAREVLAALIEEAPGVAFGLYEDQIACELGIV